ncbi:antibiotic biosynthesis monooxygenase [uncultured Roseovarius sp.]|uniref:putative quinol monooxygenase n=1 Tax=uncultured Roseovarius sp. TaxID=293344 RepID=UPI00261E81B9|nr:antibiotic biosynthesis monooxygenase [uncultured Roseovarius sp.]
MIRLTGTMRCAPDEAEAVRSALPEHIRLTRAEPGCIAFEISETAPGVFTVRELFADASAFEIHQDRTPSSDWWKITGHMTRDFRRSTE